MTEEFCEDCENTLNECTCGYDAILDIPKFIANRSATIFEKKRCKITNLQALSFLISKILMDLPSVYRTRSGHEVEEFYVDSYSDHDGARFLGTLIQSELNELLINITVGSYDSAIRGIRNLFEWVIRTTVLITDVSLFTKQSKDKHKPACFHMIRCAMELSNQKRQLSKDGLHTFKNNIKEQFRKGEINSEVKTAYLNDISSGITKYINQCDDSLIKYICLNSIPGKVPQKMILLYLYGQLSEYVHKSPKLLDKMEQNQGKLFFDSDEFDYSFNLVLISLDMIFYFYLLLLDMDVFHSSPEWKSSWRQQIKKDFDELLIPTHLMESCKTLLHSIEWNSNPPEELIFVK